MGVQEFRANPDVCNKRRLTAMLQEAKDLQSRAVTELFNKAHGYNKVLTFRAPTGSGKTIIMASFIEDVFYGTEDFVEQPNAIFVWLSDSPQLNEQSKDSRLYEPYSCRTTRHHIPCINTLKRESCPTKL